jgi:hypothetical protein
VLGERQEEAVLEIKLSEEIGTQNLLKEL